MAESADTRAETAGAAEDRNRRRSLGMWQLTAIGFSGVIGSGWLLGAMYAAQLAGPEAIVAWLVGGAALMLIALTMADLGAARPESGGLVRWPYYSSGRLVATIAGWGIWIAYATNPPSESAAMLQYMSKYVGGLYSGSSLTALGVLLGAGIMAVFVLLNWFGVMLFARVNGALTVAKFVVPTLTVIALFISGFHSANFSSHGGFSPYGWTPGLSASATAGIIYAYTGFQGPIDLSGEAKNPRRDVPRAVILSLAGSMVLYLLLQIAFVGSVPRPDPSGAAFHPGARPLGVRHGQEPLPAPGGRKGTQGLWHPAPGPDHQLRDRPGLPAPAAQLAVDSGRDQCARADRLRAAVVLRHRLPPGRRHAVRDHPRYAHPGSGRVRARYLDLVLGHLEGTQDRPAGAPGRRRRLRRPAVAPGPDQRGGGLAGHEGRRVAGRLPGRDPDRVGAGQQGLCRHQRHPGPVGLCRRRDHRPGRLRVGHPVGGPAPGRSPGPRPRDQRRRNERLRQRARGGLS